MLADIVGGKTYRKRIVESVRAIQFTGGKKSSKKVNAFLESSAGLSIEWRPAKGSLRDSFGLLRPPTEEQILIKVHGISSVMVMNVGDYLVYESDDSFGVLPKETFESQYEEVKK